MKETVTAADYKILLSRTAPAGTPKTAVHTDPNTDLPRPKAKKKSKKKFVP